MPRAYQLRIVARLCLIACALCLSAAAASAQPASILLTGAGATFPQPIYAKWFDSYRSTNSNVKITYNAVGSEAGVRDLLAGRVDFGASDSPKILETIAQNAGSTQEAGKYLLLPSVAGAVVPIINLPGFSSDIAFTPEALAGIYLGKIKKWNDPVLKQANKGVRLPDLNIVVIHRADGSGTSYVWTDYLSKTNPEWKTQVGCATTPKWPVGRAATGNDGVAKLVKELGGSIGYVEFTYAFQNHLSFGKVRNRQGEFIDANLESVAAATATGGADFQASIVDPPTAGAYPIATFTWIIVPSRVADDGKRGAITGFLKWMLGAGQRQAASLGYVALPKEIVTRELEAIAGIR